MWAGYKKSPVNVLQAVMSLPGGLIWGRYSILKKPGTVVPICEIHEWAMNTTSDRVETRYDALKWSED